MSFSDFGRSIVMYAARESVDGGAVGSLGFLYGVHDECSCVCDLGCQLEVCGIVQ